MGRNKCCCAAFCVQFLSKTIVSWQNSLKVSASSGVVVLLFTCVNQISDNHSNVMSFLLLVLSYQKL